MSQYMQVELKCGQSINIQGWHSCSAYELARGGFGTQDELDAINQKVLGSAGTFLSNSREWGNPYYLTNKVAHIIAPTYVDLADPREHPVLKHRWHEPTEEYLEVLKERLKVIDDAGEKSLLDKIASVQRQLARASYRVLPLELWGVELDCEQRSDGDWGGSSLIAVWFQEPTPDQSLRSIVESRIVDLPWFELASDYEVFP